MRPSCSPADPERTALLLRTSSATAALARALFLLVALLAPACSGESTDAGSSVPGSSAPEISSSAPPASGASTEQPDPSDTSDSDQPTDTSASDEPVDQDHRFGPPVEWDGGEQEVFELFEGVRLTSRIQREPRGLRVHIVQIDPSAPGIEFMVTPPNGPEQPRDTTSQTTRAFLEEHGLQLAINAHFFSPWPAEDDYANLLGLAVSDGEAYAPFRPNWRQAFVVTDAGEATIVEHDEAEEIGYGTAPPVEVRHGVGTNERILRAGTVTASWEELHPRTAIGVSSEGHALFLVADGRQGRFSEGLTTPEVAEILLEFGATDAINMDGGGSTTLVVADDEPRLVNRPVGYLVPGTERENGSNIGIRALPLARP